MTNFDVIHPRLHTHSVKWDQIQDTYHQTDLLPLWVADMDFQTDAHVLTAFQQEVAQGIFGYTYPSDDLYAAIQQWQVTHHQYELAKQEILFNSGVVSSLALCIQAFTNKGDAVLIHNPVYPPFARVILDNERRLIQSTLLKENDQFVMNMEEMTELIMKHHVRLLILCNPHNPGGRVWSKEELIALGELCKQHGVLVVSDEIHQDLVFAPYRMTTFPQAQSGFADFSVVLTAVTKTFNLAGIKNSMLFIQNKSLRKKVQLVQQKNQQQEINTFGYLGTKVAYQHGALWLNELMAYLTENRALVVHYFKTMLPKIKVMQPEATYLFWLDFSAYGLTDTQLNQAFIRKGKVVLNPGISFGSAGSQHMRLNIACPRQTLCDGLERIKKSLA